jgi:hypothetical protein
VGLRDVFRRVGEVIQSHAELRLAFTVGFLIAKDRKIGFEFDSVALAPVRLPPRHAPCSVWGQVAYPPCVP